MSFDANFHPNCPSEWNELDSEIRQLPTLGMFKKRLFTLIRPLPKPVYSIHDPKGLANLTQLRVGLSRLNLHNVKHNFKDTVNPMCSINDGIEDTERFCCSAIAWMCKDRVFSMPLILYQNLKAYQTFLMKALLEILLYCNERCHLCQIPWLRLSTYALQNALNQCNLFFNIQTHKRTNSV